MLTLLPETRKVLDSLVAQGASPDAVQTDTHSDICIPPADWRALVLGLARDYLNAAGLPMVRYTQQLSFAMSLAKVLPRYRGALLADRLVRLFEAWAEKGLDPYHMQLMTVHIWQGLKQTSGRAA